jgi:hypothetical protein
LDGSQKKGLHFIQVGNLDAQGKVKSRRHRRAFTLASDKGGQANREKAKIKRANFFGEREKPHKPQILLQGVGKEEQGLSKTRT